MSTQGCGAYVKNPTMKLTIDNLMKLVLSSHCENIAAAEARKLPPTGPTSQSVQVSYQENSIGMAPSGTSGTSDVSGSRNGFLSDVVRNHNHFAHLSEN